jgi:hypothetical protein
MGYFDMNNIGYGGMGYGGMGYYGMDGMWYSSDINQYPSQTQRRADSLEERLASKRKAYSVPKPTENVWVPGGP